MSTPQQSAVSAQQFSDVSSFVQARGGNRTIEKVLIANNGIGAVKAIRSMRRWAYETFSNERAVQFVVMATPEDMRANAEYIRMADEIVDVPGGSNNNNYANVMLIVEIAERWKVDAVWAGWGHASENSLLPDSLEKTARKIVFIGPPGAPMRALGDKIGSTIIAQSAGVPCIGWNGDGLIANYKDGGIPPELYAKANVTTAEQAQVVCERLGFPLMIKASEGGGGKGIRKVLQSNEVSAAYRQVASEIPGSPIFVMKLAPRSRHLEVQLLGDIYGQAIALNGRDCSIQRRHQKIIEEGPPVVAPPNIWREMEQAAISLAKEVGYSNAGTVEYLYTEEDNKFYFLELNPRLQVEHPVTEMITKVNLPAAQLQVAMGIPLHMISDIRRLYGCQDIFGTSVIDFDNTERTPPAAHCIAVRITAENPDQGFQPTSGTIQELNFRSTPDVWGYFSVDSSGLVHEFADSQFGHLFAGGADRDSARKSMIIALKELSIRGDIRTTVEYIVDLMRSSDFVNNTIDTAWLDARILSGSGTSSDTGDRRRSAVDGRLAVTIGAAITAYQQVTQQSADFCAMLSKGLLPPRELMLTTRTVELIHEGIKYILTCSQAGPKLYCIGCGGSYVTTECRSLADGGYLVIVNGKSHVVYCNNEPSGLRLVINGTTASFTKEYDPTCLDADVAGKLARCLVTEGTHLKAGAAYAEIEVMKMFMPVTVKESGIIHWCISEGAPLKPGDRLATLQLDDPSAVTKAVLFEGQLSSHSNSSTTADGSVTTAATDRPHVVLRNAIQTLEMVLWGYAVPSDQFKIALQSVKDTIRDPLVPLYEFEESLSVLSGRIDATLYSNLKQTANTYKAACTTSSSDSGSSLDATVEFPAASILSFIDEYAESLPERDTAAFASLIEPLKLVTQQYVHGVSGRIMYTLLTLVRQYLSVERGFTGDGMEACIQSLRKTHAGDIPHVYEMCRSHLAITAKNNLLLILLEHVSKVAAHVSKRSDEASNTTDQASTTSSSTSANSAITSPSRLQRMSSSAIATSPKDTNDDSSSSNKLSSSIGHGKDMSAFVPVLTEISNLSDSIYSSVAARARAMLMQYRTPSVAQRRAALLAAMTAASLAGDDMHGRLKAMSAFVDGNVPVRDLLMPLLATGDDIATAMEIYVRQTYRTHTISDFKSEQKAGISSISKCTFNTMHNEALPPGVTNTTSFVDLASLARTMSVPKSLSSSSKSLSLTAALQRDDSATFSDKDDDTTTGGDERLPPNITRYGVFAVVNSTDELSQHMTDILQALPQYNSTSNKSSGTGPVNVLHIALLNYSDDTDTSGNSNSSSGAINDEAISSKLSSLLSSHAKDLLQADVRRVTFLVGTKQAAVDSKAKVNGSDVSSITSSIYTFRSSTNYAEDPLFRHIEPTHAYSIDLTRLSNFAIKLASTSQAMGGNVHLYAGRPKTSAAKAEGLKVSSGGLPIRYFARVVSQTSEYLGSSYSSEKLTRYYVEKMFVEALSSIDLAISQADQQQQLSLSTSGTATAAAATKLAVPANNHIFINCVTPDTTAGPSSIAEHMKQLMIRFGDKIARLGITHFEMKVICRLSEDAPEVPIRLIATNPTGFVVRVDTYIEVREGSNVVFRSVGSLNNNNHLYKKFSKGVCEWEGISIQQPYPVVRQFEAKRTAALVRSDTLYCYDFLELIESAVQSLWKSFGADRPQARIVSPDSVLHATELVVTYKQGVSNSNTSTTGIDTPWSAKHVQDLVIQEVQRAPGQNDVGMVAWLLTLRTPEYPEGRQLVLIANDITYQAGSFGTREDVVFLLATRYARSKGIPRLYLAANSGARIGLAESIKQKFKVSWIDERDPSLGYRYLYLDDADYKHFTNRDAVKCQQVVDEHTGSTVWKLTDIIGEEPDLGVENLQGSGAIAGETSGAYDDIFTLTLVVGRTVGIGAYLVRLGQRTIQNVNAAPILLTGYQALNTLMGREVYASNDQLGGAISVMIPNGVSHLTADTHMEAVKSALKWLSYVPAVKSSYLPVVDITGVDTVERSIEFIPTKGTPYDPRHLIAGYTDVLKNSSSNSATSSSDTSNITATAATTNTGGSNTTSSTNSSDTWVSGFFDRDSFCETLAGWAETVVCGRARLGGIPLGVIITESRTREKKCPADPADLTSQEKIVQQAGGVWFPDSASKTAQAIRDLNCEGLPLIIFANWRGFSGGQRDMFDEVLKFGAEIVDALVDYKQPTFVYIPPFAELRGGAWVVVDSTININVMEMYVADNSRGGVLEANGAASIKFRQKDIIATAHRLDPVLQSIDKQLQDGTSSSASRRSELLSQMKDREKRLSGVYQQLSVQFADLHDTPGRMAATGAVKKVVPWSEARSFFYWRLRRRLAEFDIRKQVIAAQTHSNSCSTSSIGNSITAPTPIEASETVRQWFTTMQNHTNSPTTTTASTDNASTSLAMWDDDKYVLSWMAREASQIKDRIAQLRFQTIAADTEAMIQKSPEAVLTGLLSAMQGFDTLTKRALIDRLSAAV